MQCGFRFCFLQQVYVFQLRHWHTWHTRHSRLSSVGDSIRSKLPLNNIFLRGLAANNTTCVYVCKYFERLRRDVPDDRNTLKCKTTGKRVLYAKIPWLVMTTSIIIKITCVISMWTLHWITVSCRHGVKIPMITGYYCAILWWRKKKYDKKTKAFHDWATTGIPVKMIKFLNANSQPNIWLSMITRALSFLRKFQL